MNFACIYCMYEFGVIVVLVSFSIKRKVHRGTREEKLTP